MSIIEEYVDQTGSRPRIKWGTLAQTLVGTVLVGYWLGALEFIRSMGLFVVHAIDRFGGFWVDVVDVVLDVPAGAIEIAWMQPLETIETFGPGAPVAASLIVVVTVALAVFATVEAIRFVVRVI